MHPLGEVVHQSSAYMSVRPDDTHATHGAPRISATCPSKTRNNQDGGKRHNVDEVMMNVLGRDHVRTNNFVELNKYEKINQIAICHFTVEKSNLSHSWSS